MLSRNLEQTLHRALSLASERRHEYATLEHLLLGLAEDTDAATVLKACGVDLDKLRNDLTEFLDKDLAGLATDRRTPPGDALTRLAGWGWVPSAAGVDRTRANASRGPALRPAPGMSGGAHRSA